MRSVPVKWKKRRLDRKEKLYHDSLNRALVHPAGNSDDRMALDNIIC